MNGFGRGWRKRSQKTRRNKGGTEGGWRWLLNGSGYRGLIPIRGIIMMYDIVYTGFNLNIDHETSV